jgi:hypothetical protein
LLKEGVTIETLGGVWIIYRILSCKNFDYRLTCILLMLSDECFSNAQGLCNTPAYLNHPKFESADNEFFD